MYTRSLLNRMRCLLRLVSSIIILGSFSANVHADVGRFGSLGDLLKSDEFIEGCIGRGSGTVLLSIDPTYGDEASRLLSALLKRAEEMRVANRIDIYNPLDWESEAQCKAPLPSGPRAVVYIMPLKDSSGDFFSARIIVRAYGRCSGATLERDKYPGRCRNLLDANDAGVVPVNKFPRLDWPKAATLAPVRERIWSPPPAARRSNARSNGLMAAAVVMGGTTIAFRSMQGYTTAVEHDTFAALMWDGLGWTSTLGGAAVGVSAGVAWPVPPTYRRRREVQRGVAGGLAIAVGLASIVVARTLLDRTQYGGHDAWGLPLGGLHAFGDISAGVGASLLSTTLSRRVSIKPSLAGITVAGRF